MGSILHYTKNNNSFFLKRIYPSGKNSGKTRISKKEYMDAVDYVKNNSLIVKDLIINKCEIYYSE